MQSNEPSKLNGQYRASVISTTPPAHLENLLLAQVRLIGLWDNSLEANLPWAEYLFPVGVRPLEGDFTPVEVGDFVWVDFVNGDARCPRIVGGCHYAPEGIPNTPPECYVNDSPYEHQRHDDEPVPPVNEYHKDKTQRFAGNMVEQTKGGHYRVTNMISGSAVELTPLGQIVIHATDQLFISAGAGLKVAITGNTQIDLDGNLVANVTGTTDVKSDKNVTVTTGANMNLKSSGSMNIDAGGSMTIGAGGSIRMNGSTVHINE